MKSELRFDFEWEAPGGARGPELRATWARLRIDVGGETVTEIEDRVSASVRDAVYGPLYPVAEWIATNWWAILYEVASPARTRNGYARRHSLSAAAEGFALPRLSFRPEGSRIELSWSPQEVAPARLRFLSGGRRYLDRAQVEDALRNFVSGVVARLRDQGVTETLLAEEWSSIESSEPEERTFCTLAGSLGWDPYALEKSKTRALLEAAGRIPSEIHQEFFASAPAARLRAEAGAVRDFIDEAAGLDLRLDPLPSLRGLRKPSDPDRPPWEEGYRHARRLRRRLSLKDRRIRSESELGEALGVNHEDWRKALENGAGKLGFLDAMMAVARGGGPHFSVALRSEASRTFTLCRALFEYLHSPHATAALVAPTYSDRQKRNRAFAAEFLAPAASLRRKIAHSVVTEEEVEDLADEFGTSSLVIRHQIENHGLARLAEWTT